MSFKAYYWQSAIIAFLLIGCGSVMPSPLPAPTNTPLPSPTIIASSTPDKTDIANSLNATLITQVANDDGSPRPVLRNAQWSEDGIAVIYTLSTLTGERRFAYQLDSGNTLSLSAVFPAEATSGLISPSGRYQLVVDTSNYPTPEPGVVSPPFELWLVDNGSGERKLLFPEASGQPIVNWTADEQHFVLALEVFGEGFLYIGDTDSAQVTPLQDYAEHSGQTKYGWALSPDGSKLAIASSDSSQLQVIHLEDGRSEFAEGNNTAFFYWTPDSQRLYYKALSSEPGLEFDGYYVYDTVSQSGELLLTQDMLRAEGLCLDSCYFVPSLDGSQTLVGWGDYTHDYLWLVDIP